MSWIIDLKDIPADGLAVEQEISPSDMELPAEDGTICGLLHCVGQISFPDAHMANFQGILKGRLARECVRCLVNFEEEVACPCEVNFCQSISSALSPQSSKKSKKGSRVKNLVNEEQDDEVDAYQITDQKIDLLPALREHLILAAPLNPVCREDCAGLCQVCGANLNESACACYAPVMPSSAFDSEGGSLFSKKASKSFSRSIRRGA